MEISSPRNSGKFILRRSWEYGPDSPSKYMFSLKELFPDHVFPNEHGDECFTHNKDEVDMSCQRYSVNNHSPKEKNSKNKKTDTDNLNMVDSAAAPQRTSNMHTRNHNSVLVDEKMDQDRRRISSFQERSEYYENLPPFGFLDFFGCIISIFTFLADIGSDIFIAILYFKEGHIYMFGLTVAFIVVPALVTTCFSISWYLQDNVHYKRYGIKVSILKWICRLTFHFFQIGPVLRYIDILRYGIKSRLDKDVDSRDRRHYVELMLNEDSDTTLLRLLECFMESAPQLTLQLYILCTYGSDEILIIRIGQGIACVTALASLSWALTSYHRSLRLSLPDKAKLSYIGMALLFLWRFFVISCRVLSFALFASQYSYWIFVVAGCHWVVMFSWVLSQRTSFCDTRHKHAKCQETFFDMVIAAVYIYCFLNVTEGHTRLRYIIYYTIVYVENVAMALLWYMFAHTRTSWYIEPAIAWISCGFFLGIAIQIFYYLRYHPNNLSQERRHKQIALCLSCTEMINHSKKYGEGKHKDRTRRNLLENGSQNHHKAVPSQFV